MYKLELNLEEPDRVYFSGDDLKGEVTINLKAKLPVQAITVKFIGEACVSVPEDVVEEKVKQKRRTITNKICPEANKSDRVACWEQPTSPSKKGSKLRSSFSSQERYFCHKEFLYGHKYSSYREQLWEGKHVFPFSFTLPAQLPPSFAGRYGYVRYYCEAALLRWRLRDSRRAYFSVTNLADLNQEPKAEAGCEEHKTTNSCLFCCPKGTIVASAELRRRGFAPGEIAPICVEVHNMSNTIITSLRAVVVQVVGYISGQGLRRHEDTRRVLEVTRGEVRPGVSFTWGSAGVRLPPLPPTTFTMDSCKIMTISYRIDVMMYLAGGKEPLILQLPIIIGNVPLKRHFPLLAPELNVMEPSVPLPKVVTFRYDRFPGVASSESVNPQQSECVYKLPAFKPRYLYYTPKGLL
ncbi:unnamed protein product [Nezara viridula]|uniref:Arrestin C-terminal-like domain-containing protein n=1 Tax=Nezara viridula TaxID=85310 RepID=A0A9P0MWK4_NEZVI|nr:unnamed protein product [Nezara viridula]